MKHTFENTYVNQLDLERMAKDLEAEIGEPVEIKRFGGLILKPKAGLLDTEIVLEPIAEREGIEVDVYKAKKPLEDGREGFSISVIPSWRTTYTVEELEKYVIGTMPISEFVKDRRGYNRRLCANEEAIIKWLNKKAKVS